MKYDFDPDWFAHLVAKRLKEGYPIQIAVLLAIVQYPPMLEAILRGIELGGKHEATPSKPT